MGYTVVAPLVILRDEMGVLHHLYRDAPVPDGMDKKHLRQLVNDGMVKRTKAAPAPAPAPDDGPFDPAGATIEKVLEHVGSDQAKAEQVLELEKARGDDARSTLVTQLEELAAPQS